MNKPESRRQPISSALFAIPLALGLGLFAVHAGLGWPASRPQANPWKSSQVVEPAQLAKMVSGGSDGKPVVVCVGFDFLFKGAHVPGAQFAGPASEAAGMAALKKWAASIPRNREVILYCGCCPLPQCPNARPAFKALTAMGFKDLKVLDLPDNFQKNWVGKGYPVAKK
ncbi:MAG TPA: rhodanese-like domain-containing protein [Terriglobia bacterium]|nr:rhodanese-like domain-containing protein [Terriglobia bacterium]